jgi:hypothetical protein
LLVDADSWTCRQPTPTGFGLHLKMCFSKHNLEHSRHARDSNWTGWIGCVEPHKFPGYGTWCTVAPLPWDFPLNCLLLPGSWLLHTHYLTYLISLPCYSYFILH